MKNNKKLFYLVLVLFIIIVLIIVLLLFLFRKKTYGEIYFKNSNVYYLESDEDLGIGEYKLFTNLEDLKNYFNIVSINSDSFIKNNYLAIKLSVDDCSESDITPHHYILENDTLNVTFNYVGSCGVCAPRTVYYLLEIENTLKFNDVKVKHNMTNTLNCDINVAYKPIIYLYPEENMNISVKLLNSNYLTTTYPKYNNEWDIYAYKDGTLIDNKTGRKLYGLYWEGNNYPSKMTNEGFIVKGSDTINFLEEKLNILGLNEREADEFIIYWLPKLEGNKYNYIRFASLEEINNYMPLEINPKPNTVIRVLMEYKPLNEKISVNEQELITTQRNGFTVIEWGGSLIN